jgi:hypothetical protein
MFTTPLKQLEHCLKYHFNLEAKSSSCNIQNPKEAVFLGLTFTITERKKMELGREIDSR